MESHAQPVKKFQTFTDPDELVNNIPNWKNKYKLVQLAKVQQRQSSYHFE